MSERGGPNVLLVEDSRLNRALACRHLAALGCRVAVVTDGPDAVQACSDERFDVVLMDCELPTMDGFTAAAAIRQAEGASGRRTRIVAVTGHVGPEVGQRVSDAGMDGLLLKPLQLDHLRNLLAEWRPARD